MAYIICEPCVDIKDTEDRIRAVRVGATIDSGDRAGGVNVFDVEYSHGIGGIGASVNGDEYLSRSSGRADFQRANLYASRIQSLPAHFSVVVGVNGQYAFTDLLAPELFSWGGEQFGRGYDASELLNDHGVGAKVDLRYTRLLGGDGRLETPFTAARVWQAIQAAQAS